MARAWLDLYGWSNTAGALDIKASAVFRIYEGGTVTLSAAGAVTAGTPFSGNIYAALTGGSPIASTVTADGNGFAKVYTDAPRRVDVVLSGSGISTILYANRAWERAPEDVLSFDNTSRIPVSASVFDGVTDATAAIQAAFTTAAGLSGGATVVLPAGTALLSGGPLIIGSNIKVEGAGQGKTILKIAPNPGGTRRPDILTVGSAAASINSNVEICHLTLDGNLANYDNALSGFGRGALAIVSGRNVWIHHVEIKSAKRGGIWSSDASTKYHENIWITDCYIHDGAVSHDSITNSGNGMYLANIRGGVIRSNRVVNTEDDNIALISLRTDPSVDYCRDVVIEGNFLDTILDTGSNIVATGQRIAVVGNICRNAEQAATNDNSGNAAIRVMHSLADSGEHPATDCTIIGNVIESAKVGAIKLAAIRTICANNTIYNTVYGYGITVGLSAAAAASAAARLGNEGFVVIRGNVITDVASDPAAGSRGIYYQVGSVGPKRVVIEGNAIHNTTGIGIDINPALGAELIVLRNNTVIGSSLENIRVLGTCDLVVVAGNVATDGTYGLRVAAGTFTGLLKHEGNIFTGNSTADEAIDAAISRDVVTWASHTVTPDVSDRAKLYKTNNATATIITNFLNGRAGDVITIIFGDINTSIFDGSAIKTVGDISPSAIGQVTSFISDGTIWWQMAPVAAT